MTFGDITERILLKLDTSKSLASGDLYDDVWNTLKDVYDQAMTEIRPDELLTSATYTLPAGDTDATITGDFSISDFEKEHSLFVEGAEEPWFNVDYRTWLRGDDKRSNIWTRHGNTIYLATAPPTGDTWALELYYYKQPTTPVTGGTPEFPRPHHSLLVYGTVTQFPHTFQGDKQITLLKFEKAYEEGIAAAKRERAAAQKFRTLRPKQHQAATGPITFAGT